MSRRRNLIIIASLILVGFVLRGAIAPLVNVGDILVHREWSRSLFESGFSGFYFRQGWIYSFPTQLPLMNFLYWASQWLYQHRFVLAITHNWIKLPPAALLFWLDKRGEFFFVKLWGILGDLLAALLIYWLVKKEFKKNKEALFLFVFLVFNPIAIFISSIWGQTGTLSAVLALFAFYLFWKGSIGPFFSPLVFALAGQVKPVVAVFIPLYLLALIWRSTSLSSKQRQSFWVFWLAGSILAASLFLASFLPFWDRSDSYFQFIRSVFKNKILTSAKGASKASISAFNLYALLFIPDYTPGMTKIGPITIDQLGTGLIIVLNFLAAYFLLRTKNQLKTSSQLFCLATLMYFLGEGTFLFGTSMLERYFLPAFLPLCLAYPLLKKKEKALVLFQIGIWFVNLFYGLFWREIPLVALIFKSNNFFLMRILSFFNLLIYFLLIGSILSRQRKIFLGLSRK